MRLFFSRNVVYLCAFFVLGFANTGLAGNPATTFTIHDLASHPDEGQAFLKQYYCTDDCDAMYMQTFELGKNADFSIPAHKDDSGYSYEFAYLFPKQDEYCVVNVRIDNSGQINAITDPSLCPEFKVNSMKAGDSIDYTISN